LFWLARDVLGIAPPVFLANRPAFRAELAFALFIADPLSHILGRDMGKFFDQRSPYVRSLFTEKKVVPIVTKSAYFNIFCFSASLRESLVHRLGQ